MRFSRVSAIAGTMRAWITPEYKAPLTLAQIPTPQISRPDHVIVRVKASSLNPIDTRMRLGYGDELLTFVRQLENCSLERPPRLPLITGRDFCGEVVAVGNEVSNVRVGDEVIGVIPGAWQGAHADYALTSSDAVSSKPANLSPVEATTLPYVACTTWAALVTIARLRPYEGSEKRVLIHGGSGGVGSAAIQLLKIWGVEKIVATASSKNLDYITSLGGVALDYNSPTVKEEIIEHGPYDVVLDCANTDLARWSDSIMGIWRNCVHVSIVSPLLRDTDRYGLAMGLASTAARFIERSACSATQGKWFGYAFFAPNSECLNQVTTLLSEGRLRVPNIEKVYSFDEAPTAYEHCSKLHTRGKLVLDYGEVASEVRADDACYARMLDEKS